MPTPTLHDLLQYGRKADIDYKPQSEMSPGGQFAKGMEKTGATGAWNWFERNIEAPFGTAVKYSWEKLTPWQEAGQKRIDELKAQGLSEWEAARQVYDESNAWIKMGTQAVNPLYWIPVGGWATKAGTAAGRLATRAGAETAGRAITQAAKVPLAAERAVGGLVAAPFKGVGKITAPALRKIAKPEVDRMLGNMERWGLKDYGVKGDIVFRGEGLAVPSTEEIMANLVRPTTAKALARQVSHIPVVGKPAQKFMGLASRNAFIQSEAEARVLAENIRSSWLARSWPDAFNRLNALGDQYKIWGTRDLGQIDDVMARNVKLKKGQSPYIDDVLEHYTEYELTSLQRAWAQEYHAIRQEWRALLKKEGITKLGAFDDTLHSFRQGMGRMNKEMDEIAQWEPASAVGGGKVGREQSFLKPRSYETQAEGVADRIVYNANKVDTLQNELKMMTKIFRDENIKRQIQPMAKRTTKVGEIAHYDPSTEAMIHHPAFQGYIFDKEVTEAFKRGMGEPVTRLGELAIPIIKPLTNVSKGLRTAIATLDLSGPFIQGLPVLGKNPALWAKEAYRSFTYMLKPQNFAKYMTKPENIRTANLWRRYGLYIGGSEYAMGRAPIEAFASKVGGIAGEKGRIAGRGLVRKTYGRTEVAFSSFGDAARLEMAKAMEPLCKTADDFVRVASELNKMTGVISPLELGLGRTQQLTEQLFFFAPRYLRAGFALSADIFRGGMGGALARESLGHFMAGGMIFYIQTCRALGAEPQLDPTKATFMTVPIGNQNIGIGGFMTSGFRFMSHLVTYTVEGDWKGLGKQEGESLSDYFTRQRQENPFLKFFYSKTSPFVGGVAEIWTGRDYMGEEYETPSDWAKFLADKTLPIAVQSAWQEPNVASMAAEFAGARTFPQNAWTKTSQLRDQRAQEAFGKSWDDLEADERQNLRTSFPDIAEAEKNARESWVSGVEGKTQAEWSAKRDNIQSKYLEALGRAQQAFLDGQVDGEKFREMVDDASLIKRDDYNDLKNEYPGIYTRFKDKEIDPDHAFDIALDEYYAIWDEPEAVDQYGLINWDVVETARQAWATRWPDMVERVQTYIAEGHSDEPELVQELRKAREILRPYWQIRDYVLSSWKLPDGTPIDLNVIDNNATLEKLRNSTDPRAKIVVKIIEDRLGLTAALQAVTEVRRLVRTEKNPDGTLKNPEIARYYDMFYG